MKIMVILTVIGALGTISKRIVTETGRLGNKRLRGDHLNYSIVEIGQNTEKNLGDLRRLAVTYTPVENHQLMLGLLWLLCLMA